MKNNILLILLSISINLACKDKGTTPNSPPNAFMVKSIVGIDGKTVTLNWTNAIDPEGDPVTYTVVLDTDTLVKNLIDTIFILKNLNFDYSGNGFVIAYDNKKLSRNSSFNVITQANPIVKIPDSNFEKYLLEMNIDRDGLLNGEMLKSDALGIEELTLLNYQNYTNFNGIEAFVDLKKFTVNGSFSNLDLSNNAKLEVLNTKLSNFSSINITKNYNLIELQISSPLLKKIDLTQNLNLKILNLSRSGITELNTSKNINLEYLDCLACSSLSSLNLNKNIKLKYLDCSSNSFKNLDLSENLELEGLKFYRNQIPINELNLCSNLNLKYLMAFSSRINIIKINKNIIIDEFWQKSFDTSFEKCQ